MELTTRKEEEAERRSSNLDLSGVLRPPDQAFSDVFSFPSIVEHLQSDRGTGLGHKAHGLMGS